MTERPPHTESELVEFVRSIDVRAPDSLHQRVESLVAERPRIARPRSLSERSSGAGRASIGRRLAAAGAMAAVVAVALAVILGGGRAPGLSLRQASALTLRPATVAAPVASHNNRVQLAAAVDGVSFPYWEEHFGWRAAGARTDRIGGRAITTVFYTDGRGRRVGYAIVGGTPAPSIRGGVVAWRDQMPYRLLTENGAPVVSWLRHGHLCVVSGRDVAGATLLALASWGDRGAVAS
jgi:hypothetical protein